MPDRPEFLLVAFAALPVALILWRRYVTGKKDLELLGGNWLKLDYATVFVVKWFFSSLFFIIFIFLATAALAGFRWGSRPVPDERRGYEVVFVFDLSNSMLADDAIPSRLRRSAILAKEIAQAIPDARFGAVGFKGHGSVLIPITEDTTALYNLLDVLSPRLITSPGTNIEAGLSTGLTAFSEMFDSYRYLFLFSDGEELEGNPITLAEQIASSGIRLTVVGVGSELASKIPVGDGVYLTDPDGNELTTELRRDVLTKIGKSAGGDVFWAEDTGIRDQLLGQVGAAKKGSGWGYLYQSTDKYRVFLLFSLLSLAISLIIRGIRWRETF